MAAWENKIASSSISSRFNPARSPGAMADCTAPSRSVYDDVVRRLSLKISPDNR